MSRPILRLLQSFVPLAVLLLGACTSNEPDGASSATSEPDAPAFVGPPSRITWRVYKSGQAAPGPGTEITLVNQSHTDRLEFYSEVRQSASTKVQNDEIVAALVEFFVDEEDFEDYAIQGSAPAGAIGQATQSLELEVDAQRRHMLWGVDRPAAERDCFTACRDALMYIWNDTYAAQAVENERGEAVFGTASQAPKKSR